jgi:thiol:disulfide interchange protein DsbD
MWLVWILGSSSQPSSQSSQPSASKIQWRKFSPQLVAALREEGKPIFIDFTAKWCLTCQVNERLALDHAKVVEKFKELGVVAVKADWTDYDPQITAALAQFGKNSIPFYVLYPTKGSRDPVIYPEIITPQIILNSFDKNLVE